MSRKPCTKAWCETVPHHSCGGSHDEHVHFSWGRCRSGKRWFWSVTKWGDEWPRWYGWTDTEETAKQTAYEKVREIANGSPVYLHTSHGSASSTLRDVSREKRKERMAANPSKATGVSSHGTLWVYRTPYDGDWKPYWEEHRIIKVTKKFVWVQERCAREDDGLVRLDREKLEREGEIWSCSACEHYYTEAGMKAWELDKLQHHADWLKHRFAPLPEMPEHYTRGDVMKAFREGSLIHHPDQGGDAETFRKLVEMKNAALEILDQSEAAKGRSAEAA